MLSNVSCDAQGASPPATNTPQAPVQPAASVARPTASPCRTWLWALHTRMPPPRAAQPAGVVRDRFQDANPALWRDAALETDEQRNQQTIRRP
jgi:hypothetical protein